MLDLSFFEQDAVLVAERLIGCYLVRRIGSAEIVVRLTETEAYLGGEDPASHAHRGVTPRNRLMFGEAGRLYVYLSYGIHYCMNIVTNEPGIPGAVLLRGAIVSQGLEHVRRMRPGVADRLLLNGPGKLTKGLGITLELNGYVLTGQPPGELYVVRGESPWPVLRTPRIGISRGQNLPWRFAADVR